MKLPIKTTAGTATGEMDVPFEMISSGRGTQAVHDVVVAYRAAQRLGTACTKTVGEVAGTNKKPWRQKGTGRARAGSFRSPLWRGGGVVFGPRPRDYTKKVSRKTKVLALRKALTERVRAGEVIVVDQLQVSSPKTKEILKVFKSLEISGSVLVITTAVEDQLLLATRNIQKVEVTTAASVNVYQVLHRDRIIVTREALEAIGKRLNEE